MTSKPYHNGKAPTETNDDEFSRRGILGKIAVLGGAVLGVMGMAGKMVHDATTVQGTPPTSEDVRIITAEGITAELTDVGLTPREDVFTEVDITVAEPGEYHIRLALLDAEETVVSSIADVETLYDGEVANHRQTVHVPMNDDAERVDYETVVVRVLPEEQI